MQSMHHRQGTHRPLLFYGLSPWDFHLSSSLSLQQAKLIDSTAFQSGSKGYWVHTVNRLDTQTQEMPVTATPSTFDSELGFHNYDYLIAK